jgi:hypothetical protein
LLISLSCITEDYGLVSILPIMLEYHVTVRPLSLQKPLKYIEVYSLIMAMNRTKLCGHDGFNSLSMKVTIHFLRLHIREIFLRGILNNSTFDPANKAYLVIDITNLTVAFLS